MKLYQRGDAMRVTQLSYNEAQSLKQSLPSEQCLDKWPNQFPNDVRLIVVCDFFSSSYYTPCKGGTVLNKPSGFRAVYIYN